MEQISNRFKNIRKILKLSQTEFASELDITKQAISNIETSKSAPGLNVLFKLHKKFNVNLNYVLCGSGEAFLSNAQNYQNIRNSLMEEVEEYLNKRGIV